MVLEKPQRCGGKGFRVRRRNRETGALVNHEIETSAARRRGDGWYAERSSLRIDQTEPFPTRRSRHVGDARKDENIGIRIQAGKLVVRYRPQEADRLSDPKVLTAGAQRVEIVALP